MLSKLFMSSPNTGGASYGVHVQHHFLQEERCDDCLCCEESCRLQNSLSLSIEHVLANRWAELVVHWFSEEISFRS